MESYFPCLREDFPRVRKRRESLWKLPERFWKCPEGFGKRPERVWKELEDFRECPERLRKGPEGSWKGPERFRKLAESVRKRPEGFWQCPERFRKLPEIRDAPAADGGGHVGAGAPVLLSPAPPAVTVSAMEYADLLAGESPHELKMWPVHPDDLAAGLVAFANTDGGELYLGVNDRGEIEGVGDSDRVARDVDNVAANNCEPPITVLQETLRSVDGRMVVVVRVPKGDMRPYRTNRGVYYVRTSSGRRQASREELLRLFQATESLYYDETPFPRLSLQDLDLAAFESYLAETGQAYLRGDDPERLLANWYLITNGHPTLAGLLLFGRKPQQHLPYAQINAARFAGTDSSFDPR